MRSLFAFVLLGALLPARNAAQDAKPLPLPDARYKADILLVVAHPDDEGAATAYLARAIDEGKRLAVVYGTRGSSGANEVGTEQAAALGDIREIEARRANATLGISNVWFLGGKDTASQNVLTSLANWEHGPALEHLVRLMRLTRPEVVLTFLPGTFIGEDHGDHQASGVLATEAFDLAGDASVFPSQVAGPTKRLEPYLDNLRPWQPKKIYYFPDADRDDIFRGKGPEYTVKEISKLTKKPYWRASLDAYRVHETQSKSFGDQLSKMDDAAIEKMMQSDGWTDTQWFVLGKSLVGGSVTGNVFENIGADAIPFSRAAISAPPAGPSDVVVELGGPWSYYTEFRRMHGLEHLPHPEPPEIALQAGSTLVVPLWLKNSAVVARDVVLSVDAPNGWAVQNGTGKFTLVAKQWAAERIEIALPALADDKKPKDAAREVTIRAESDSKTVGIVKLKVELRKRALAQ